MLKMPVLVICAIVAALFVGYYTLKAYCPSCICENCASGIAKWPAGMINRSGARRDE